MSDRESLLTLAYTAVRGQCITAAYAAEHEQSTTQHGNKQCLPPPRELPAPPKPPNNQPMSDREAGCKTTSGADSR